MAAFTDSQQHLHTSLMMLTVAWNFSRNTSPSQVTWRKFWGYTPRIRSVFTNHSNAMKINQYGSNKNYCWGRLIELLINIRIFELGFGLSISSQKPKCFNKFEITEEGIWCMHCYSNSLRSKMAAVVASPVHTGRLHGHSALVIRGASLQC